MKCCEVAFSPPIKPCALSPAHLNISPFSPAFSIQSKAPSALVWIKELLGIPSESILYVRLGRVCERVHIFCDVGLSFTELGSIK